MTPRAYYNEVDAYAAQWLRNLIAAGIITAGDVDTRSIVDVQPSDLRGYTRCHFFAGIGVWDYALGLAGWPADRPVWTGSCPCQPFSTAGRRGGTADERHLWPAWYHLICECGPAEILGEQVASRDGLDWLDLVHADLDGLGYAFGAADLCAAGVGAPHIRQRSWFVAHAEDVGRREGGPDARWIASRDRAEGRAAGLVYGGANRELAHADGGDARPKGLQRGGEHGQRQEDGRARLALGDAEGVGREGRESLPGSHSGRIDVGAGPVGFWSDADWIPCRDGKARPVEPGSFPLAHGVAGRVGRLRAYGNAIVAPVAAAFVAACLDVLPATAAAE
ncbi:MAG: DNA cytosine methyltransferase [Parafilimonas terrae]|nr:DNA cytosine methyltransferase [Parafilimonas terrae]